MRSRSIIRRGVVTNLVKDQHYPPRTCVTTASLPIDVSCVEDLAIHASDLEQEEDDGKPMSLETRSRHDGSCLEARRLDRLELDATSSRG